LREYLSAFISQLFEVDTDAHNQIVRPGQMCRESCVFGLTRNGANKVALDVQTKIIDARACRGLATGFSLYRIKLFPINTSDAVRMHYI